MDADHICFIFISLPFVSLVSPTRHSFKHILSHSSDQHVILRSFITLFLLLAKKKTHKCSSTQKKLVRIVNFYTYVHIVPTPLFSQKTPSNPSPHPIDQAAKVSRKSDVGTAKNDARRGKPGFLVGARRTFLLVSTGLTVFFLDA